MRTPSSLHPLATGCLGLLLAVAGSVAAAAEESLPADSKVHYPWPGGVDPRPYLTSVQRAQQDQEITLLLKWSGLGGPYQVWGRADVASGDWTGINNPTTDQSMVIPVGQGSNFLRVEAPRPDYIGGSVCRGCHPTAHDGWQETAHQKAFETLKNIGQGANPQCLPCHTVGFGLPGGFVSEASTPRLTGVQCENCHGPGGSHVADPGDLAVRPVISEAGTMCGGCHNGFHHPTYDEWLTAGHSQVLPELAGDFLNPDVATAEARMRSCGACHSGAVRLAMLNGAEAHPPVELPAMPSGDHAANTATTCAVCHTAHEKTPFGSQLRNPSYSTNFFSYSTSTNSNFALQYNVDINVCGQCHNQRGARWQDTSRPPHHSPQYNILVGAVGYESGTPVQSTHREIPKQCTHCHTHPHGSDNPSEEEPVYTGHAFEPLSVNCAPCHTSEEAETFIGFTQRTAHTLISEVKDLLDTWGQTKSPEPLRTKYAALAWEYQNAGQLSQPTNGPAVRGPTSAEQSIVPDEIKQARFYLYLVEHDGSYGVHNGRYTRHLLDEAAKRVQAELAKP